MRALKIAAVFALAFMPQTCYWASGADIKPGFDTAMAQAPQFAVPVPGVSPPAPQQIAVISCRADDLTGQPGRHGVTMVDGKPVFDPESAAKNWRDLELHVVDGELQCKRQLIAIEDKDVMVNNAEPLHANFGEPTQCARASALFFTTVNWDAQHRGWAVVGVGCPTPIVDSQGVIIEWHMPECPRKLGTIEGIKCKFDESVI